MMPYENPIGDYPDLTPKQLEQIQTYYLKELLAKYTTTIDTIYDTKFKKGNLMKYVTTTLIALFALIAFPSGKANACGYSYAYSTPCASYSNPVSSLLAAPFELAASVPVAVASVFDPCYSNAYYTPYYGSYYHNAYYRSAYYPPYYNNAYYGAYYVPHYRVRHHYHNVYYRAHYSVRHRYHNVSYRPKVHHSVVKYNSTSDYLPPSSLRK
jgi:hypothetical protein